MKNFTIYLLIIGFVTFTFSSCIEVQNPYSKIPPGKWRAVLKLDQKWMPGESLTKAAMNNDLQRNTKIAGGELPINFEVIYSSPDDFYIELINGEERMKLEDITFGRDKATAKDTLKINFPVFDSYIELLCQEDHMEGRWVRKNRENYAIPFYAKHGQTHRFTNLKKAPKMDVSGKWEVTFEEEDGSQSKAIGEFNQDENTLTGTFMTETGDYRFLEGTVQGNKFYLSTFDGAHAFLFEAVINDDQSIEGIFRSGNHYQATWTAIKNESFELGDANKLTFLNEGYDKIAFNFENPEGKIISLENPEYRNKVKLVQILGTWCPNCRDETKFINAYLKANPNEDLEVIGLAFEAYRDKAQADKLINIYKEQFGINYEIVHAGYRDKAEASKVLPMINKVISYPTMIFIDKQDQIRKIHTGFSGPATSTFQDYKKEFENFVGKLLAE
jgi:thiol-disulfide isomerase/thioredoxin